MPDRVAAEPRSAPAETDEHVGAVGGDAVLEQVRVPVPSGPSPGHQVKELRGGQVLLRALFQHPWGGGAAVWIGVLDVRDDALVRNLTVPEGHVALPQRGPMGDIP